MRDYTRGCRLSNRKHAHLADAVMTNQLIGDSAAFDRVEFFCSRISFLLPTVDCQLSLNQEPKNCRDRFAVAVMVWRCHAFTDFTVAVLALTDLSSYFSEILVVVLGSVDMYVKYCLCIFVCGRNPHYAGGRFKRVSNLLRMMRI